MADFQVNPIYFPQPAAVSVHAMYGPSITALSGVLNNRSSRTFPSANLGIFIPWVVQDPITIKLLGWPNGSAVSGNIDMAIYDAQGNRIVSMGSTAQSGTSAYQALDITDTTLNPGLYYIAGAADNTTATYLGNNTSSPAPRSLGIRSMASAFPLPATATLASYTSTSIPDFLATTQTVI